MAKNLNKILFLLIYLMIIFSQAGSTSADLSDKESSVGNTMRATTLAFSTRNSFNEEIISHSFSTYGLVASGFDLNSIRIKKEGELAAPYNLSAQKTSGDDSVCNALKISIMQNNQFIYQGNIASLNLNSNINNNPDDWIIFIALSDYNDSLKNKMCNFNFNFVTRLNEKEKGFSDFHFISNNITI